MYNFFQKKKYSENNNTAYIWLKYYIKSTMKTMHIFYQTPGKTIRSTHIFNKMACKIKRIFTCAYMFNHIKDTI